MNKIISIFAILLFSTGAYAAGCDNGSLKGKYGYDVSGVNLVPLPAAPGFDVRSTHVVGQAKFDGAGVVSLFGTGSTAGSPLISKTGTGTYLVDSATCAATGKIIWDLLPGEKTPLISDFYMVLVHTDNSDSHSVNKAYQANVVITDSNGHSASGSFTRMVGKFK